MTDVAATEAVEAHHREILTDPLEVLQAAITILRQQVKPPFDQLPQTSFTGNSTVFEGDQIWGALLAQYLDDVLRLMEGYKEGKHDGYILNVTRPDLPLLYVEPMKMQIDEDGSVTEHSVPTTPITTPLMPKEFVHLAAETCEQGLFQAAMDLELHQTHTFPPMERAVSVLHNVCLGLGAFSELGGAGRVTVVKGQGGNPLSFETA